MVSGKCPHPWNKNKNGTFKKGHINLNTELKGCFRKGEINTPIEKNRKIQKERYKQGLSPFSKINKIRKGSANYHYGIPRREWNKLAKQILKRDNFTCQACGADLNKRKSNCHHIKPYKPSKDNSPENLVSLCIPCHASIEYYTSIFG